MPEDILNNPAHLSNVENANNASRCTTLLNKNKKLYILFITEDSKELLLLSYQLFITPLSTSMKIIIRVSKNFKVQH